MSDAREQLIEWIEADREKLVDFFSRFIQAKSPNPPGDTREAAKFICKFLEEEELPYRVIAPQEEMPNVVATFECARADRIMTHYIDACTVDSHASSRVVAVRGVADPFPDDAAGALNRIPTCTILSLNDEYIKGRAT